MIMKYLVVSTMLFVFSLNAFGQKADIISVNKQTDCSTQVVPYQDRKKIQDPVFDLDLTSPKGGRLRYVGVPRHSFDPGDPEFSEFEKVWNDFKPTAAFFEGDTSPVAATRDDAIRKSGEPGLVQFLAARDHVPASSLEPSRQDEINYLLTKFSAEQIELFYVLRIIAEDRVRQKLSEEELRAEGPGLIKYFSKFKGLDGVIGNTDELAAAYSRYWKTPQNWWEAPTDWFNPLKSSSQTGGVFTNEVNQASSSYRDINMYSVLAKAATEGKKVFALVGRDHIPMQEEALKCALR
jgi:hypothetical protein